MPERISTLDSDYVTGQLSLFPETTDTKDSLYTVTNNAVTRLTQSLTFNGKNIIVQDASGFPTTGLVRIGPAPGESGPAELIYYGSRTGTVFRDLIRGFAGSRQNRWQANSWATNSVTAEPHNAIKDALINMQTKVGLLDNPAEGSLHQIIRSLEVAHLNPKPLFRAFPRSGPPSLIVRFQNFSSSNVIRFLWDFGDGTTSIEESPIHTYQSEGIYTVKLNVITTTGAQGIATKTNYITVSEEEIQPFFYVSQENSSNPPYSQETANAQSATAATWNFIDQTDGNIIQRFWVFGDGTTESQEDPDIHYTTHVYESPGSYDPSLFILFDSNDLRQAYLQDSITVT